MRGQLLYDVEVEDERDLQRLRDTLADTLRDMGVRVINEASSYHQEPFTVIGAIKGKPDEPWMAVYQAADREDAQAQAIAEDSKRTVNAVLRGDHLQEEPEADTEEAEG